MMNGKTVKDKCGFLAIGAYGGNQCVHFYKKGYPTLFVNTALQDLDSLTEVDGMYKYHIPRGEGCNKDRSKSKKILITLSMRLKKKCLESNISSL